MGDFEREGIGLETSKGRESTWRLQKEGRSSNWRLQKERDARL
jgi:hypothetical protein